MRLFTASPGPDDDRTISAPRYANARRNRMQAFRATYSSRCRPLVSTVSSLSRHFSCGLRSQVLHVNRRVQAPPRGPAPPTGQMTQTGDRGVLLFQTGVYFQK